MKHANLGEALASYTDLARSTSEAIARTVRTIVGVPDYELYLQHVLEHHPEVKPMTREEFARDQLENRYNRPGNRCC